MGKKGRGVTWWCGLGGEGAVRADCLKRWVAKGGLGARKTPHLLLAKTPAFSSPLGEGEEGTGLEGSWWFGVGCAEEPSPIAGGYTGVCLSLRRG